MFFDILIIIIIIVCAVFGFRHGFLISLSRIGGWIGALLVAFFFHKRFGNWLMEHTSFYTDTQERVQRVCETFITNYTGDSDPSAGAGGFGATLDKIGEALATAAAEQITAHLWTVISFVTIVIGIKVILFVLTLLLSKRFHGGFVGGIDGVAGLLFGLFQAIVAILVFFALLLPISYTVSAKTHDQIERSMESSIIAEFIYENNPILDFIDGFLPTGLTPEKWLSEDHYENVLYADKRLSTNNTSSIDELLDFFGSDDDSADIGAADADTADTGAADTGAADTENAADAADADADAASPD